MKIDLLKEAEGIAIRRNIARADMMTRRMAEQRMRGMALHYVARAVSRAVTAFFNVLATPTYADRLYDPEHAAIR